MNRIAIGIGAVLFSFSLFATPQPCPSEQWTVGQPVAIYDGNAAVTQVATVDWDEDGKLDVVGIGGGGPVGSRLLWWKGAGDNTFGSPTSVLTAGVTTNIVIADATGDGLDDVILGLQSSSRLYILPATGSGRGAAIEKPIATSPTQIFAINRDLDPEVELFISSSAEQNFTLYDNIASTPNELARISTMQSPEGIVSADLDADGRLDVAVASFPQKAVAVYYGKGTGTTFEVPISLSDVGPSELRIADLDADGKMDLVVGSRSSDPNVDDLVAVYRNPGGRNNFLRTTVRVALPSKLGSQNDTGPIHLADVSGDGVIDLIAGVAPLGTENISWVTTAIGIGDGTFRSPTFLDVLLGPGHPLWPGAITSGDFDHDDDRELVIGGGYDGLFPTTGSCATQVDFYAESPVITVGQDAALYAHVSGFAPTTPAPLGTVNVQEEAITHDTVSADAAGVAAFSIGGLGLGDHPLHAEFSGNTEIAAAISATVNVHVTSESTQTTLTLPAFPAVYGQSFPIQIAVQDLGSQWVTVHVDGMKYQHFTSAAFDKIFEPGSHTIDAKFFGSDSQPPSQSTPVMFDVAKATPTMLKSGALAVRAGTSHSLIFTVNGVSATGSVEITEGTNVIATGSLVNGAVTLTPVLTRGAHDVQATYTGDEHNAGVAQSFTLEVLPNLPLAIEARGLSAAVHVAYVLPADTNPSSLQLFRRIAGTPTWTLVAGWNAGTGIDGSASRGVVYDYQLHASLNNGTPMTSPIDSALLFHDDLLATGIAVKRAHFDQLRLAVNLMRAQAGLAPFEFDATYTSSQLIRASHLSGLRAALAQARQALGMSVPTFSGGGVGTLIQATHIQELRELAR
jgi:hypothetical protein